MTNYLTTFHAKHLFLCFLLVFVQACSTTPSGVVAGAALTIEDVAELVLAECGNVVPGGTCLPSSRISTEEKNGLKKSLQTGLDYVKDGNNLLLSGEAAQGMTLIGKSEALLDSIKAILDKRGIK